MLRRVRQITRTWSQLYINTSFMDLKYTALYTANSTFRADSVVGVATGYELDGRGIESRWRWDLPHPSRPAPRPTHSLIQWVPGFPGVKRLGCGVDYPPPSSAEVKEREVLYFYSPSGTFVACSRVYFTFTVHSELTGYHAIWLILQHNPPPPATH